ncbi:MAG: M15 family metallopeptidase [Clostridia bacterium]|nr:M15 family metallopeptidase [Clostridia bacterium]
MGNNQKPPRSFNTIRRSQTKERAKRSQLSRVVLLAIFASVALILLSLLILGVCSIVDAVSNATDRPTEPNQPIFPSFNARYDASYLASNSDVHIGELILVNEDHAFELFDESNGHRLSNKVELKTMVPQDYNGKAPYLAADGAKMEATAYQQFNKMMLAYLKEKNDDTIQVNAKNAYREYADQTSSIYSTPAGYSDHHTGYCVALTIRTATTTGISPSNANYRWLFEHAHEYGFVQRYPEGKSDETGVSAYEHCFRYVGVAHATYMYSEGLCLEEYHELLKNSHTVNNALRIAGADGKYYEVYYVAASQSDASEDAVTTFPVPSNYQYTVSGNNVDGFIVTVNLSVPAA